MARYIPGGRVVLADGTYELGGAVNLTRQKVHLQGVGGATHLRPSTTGFDTLISVNDIHCRVGYMLLLDSGDTQHDLRYAVYEASQFWTILESLHTHGAEVRFDGSVGPAVIQHEYHGSTASGDNDAAVDAIRTGVDGGGFSTSYLRVHGGWIEAPDRRAVHLSEASECTVEGLHARRASLESVDTYDLFLFGGDTGFSTVQGCNFAGLGEPRYIVLEGANGTDNSVLGNRLTGGVTADLQLNGTGVSGGNYADGTIK